MWPAIYSTTLLYLSIKNKYKTCCVNIFAGIAYLCVPIRFHVVKKLYLNNYYSFLQEKIVIQFIMHAVWLRT